MGVWVRRAWAGALVVVSALLALPASAPAAITCDFNQGAGTLTTGGVGSDSGQVTVGAGDAIQIFDEEISSSVPVTCSGDPSPTVANTDNVNLIDTVAGANVAWLAEDPEKFTSGANETELIVAPGSGSDTFVVLDSNSTTDLWGLGNAGLDWNNTADADVAFVGNVDNLRLLAGDGDDVVAANPLPSQLGGPWTGPPGLEIDGGRDNDAVLGGETNDELTAREGTDTIQGNGGNDLLLGGPGTNQLNGSAGVDRAVYEDSAVEVSVDLNLTTFQSTGFSSDRITFVEGIDGSPQADTLIGNSGVNPLDGAAGDDLLDGRGGNDALIGQAGTDTAAYDQAPAGVNADLTAGTASGGAGTDTLNTVENLTGSPFGDTLTGSAFANSINGLAGNDTVAALAGPDAVDVRDGGPDTASCGSEIDAATADQASIDAVNADCETVSFLPEPEPDAGGGGGAGGDGGGGIGDTELSFDLSGKTKQKVLKQKGVVVSASCPLEACTATASGKGKLPKPRRSPLAKINLKPVTEAVDAGVAEKIKLRLKKKSLKGIAAVLRAGKKPKVTVSASVTDAAGNVATDKQKVAAKR